MNPPKPVYASLARRLRATLIDGLLLLALCITLPMVSFQFGISDGAINGWLIWAPLLFLEPILVSFWGRTVGESLYGLCVVTKNGNRCSLPTAMLRYYSKALLGVWSVFYVLFSDKRQTIHDIITGTVVIVTPAKLSKDPDISSEGDIRDENYVYPSSIRRFIAFVGWYILSIIGSIIFLSIVVVVIGDRERGTPAWVNQWLTLIDVFVLLLLTMLAADGRLPGAKRILR